jgi:hypothetical protein
VGVEKDKSECGCGVRSVCKLGTEPGRCHLLRGV